MSEILIGIGQTIQSELDLGALTGPPSESDIVLYLRESTCTCPVVGVWNLPEKEIEQI